MFSTESPWTGLWECLGLLPSCGPPPSGLLRAASSWLGISVYMALALLTGPGTSKIGEGSVVSEEKGQVLGDVARGRCGLPPKSKVVSACGASSVPRTVRCVAAGLDGREGQPCSQLCGSAPPGHPRSCSVASMPGSLRRGRWLVSGGPGLPGHVASSHTPRGSCSVVPHLSSEGHLLSALPCARPWVMFSE